MDKEDIYLLESLKTNLNNSIKEFFRATDYDKLEFYKFDILLRIEYIFKRKFSQITGVSVNTLIQNELNERKAERDRLKGKDC